MPDFLKVGALSIYVTSKIEILRNFKVCHNLWASLARNRAIRSIFWKRCGLKQTRCNSGNYARISQTHFLNRPLFKHLKKIAPHDFIKYFFLLSTPKKFYSKCNLVWYFLCTHFWAVFKVIYRAWKNNLQLFSYKPSKVY